MNSTILIFIPFPREEEALATYFYTKQLGLENREGDFELPNSNCLLRLRVCQDITAINSQFEPASLFSAPIFSNMLSTCEKWLKNGVEIKYLHSDPGGYTAIVVDPFGNNLEFTCDNWDETDRTIDPFAWPFYKRY